MLTLAAASLGFCLLSHFAALVPLLSKAYLSPGSDFLSWALPASYKWWNNGGREIQTGSLSELLCVKSRAPAFRIGSLPRSQGSCAKTKSFCQLWKTYHSLQGFCFFEYVACVRFYRSIFLISVCLAPSLTLWMYQQNIFQGQSEVGATHPSFPFSSCRRYLNKTSDEELTTEKPSPLPEGASADPVTLRRRTLAAAAERRLQMQQNS